jgi:hypothetical protein
MEKKMLDMKFLEDYFDDFTKSRNYRTQSGQPMPAQTFGLITMCRDVEGFAMFPWHHISIP